MSTIDLLPINIPLRWRLVERVGMLFAMLTGEKENNRDREQRFASILRDYGSVISGVCFAYANNADDLKDLRQDIMLNIWKGIASFRGDSSLSTWIYRVALNTCVSTIRKKSGCPSMVPLEGISELSEEGNSNLENIEILHELISTLSPLDKAVITMWLDERKYEEIAEVTGISRNNVAVRINRIKQKLGRRLKE